ncbi:hypothetical protein EYF80_027789 [Liparis tanakae]|uniref:Uncharacterized protein n=1 Tax=Liparis tanakae TaxID=230148 RepID=A0A4Z2HAN8_9TELE|nr:hypothetical protein EYF80_027789 [Liparis tanakae]
MKRIKKNKKMKKKRKKNKNKNNKNKDTPPVALPEVSASLSDVFTALEIVLVPLCRLSCLCTAKNVFYEATGTHGPDHTKTPGEAANHIKQGQQGRRALLLHH